MVAFTLMTACGSQPSGPAMTFHTVGTKGSTVFVTLASPSSDAVSEEDLANRLRKDWEKHLIGNQIHVMVFDNDDAPQQWLAIWDRLVTMSDQEWATYQSQIFPHYIANYDRNTTSGLHEVQFFSRDKEGKVVRTIDFS
jgi:hypothetical protein